MNAGDSPTAPLSALKVTASRCRQTMAAAAVSVKAKTVNTQISHSRSL